MEGGGLKVFILGEQPQRLGSFYWRNDPSRHHEGGSDYTIPLFLNVIGSLTEHYNSFCRITLFAILLLFYQFYIY